MFTFYNLLRYRPKVVVVYRSFREAQNGGPKYQVREAETDEAMRVAGVEWEQWLYRDHPDSRIDARDVHAAIRGHDLVIGPAHEPEGHEQHNAVARILDSYRDDSMIRYLTYERGHGRSEGVEIVPTDEEKALKAQALACYPSQAAYAPTAYWFGDDQREFVL